MSKLKIFERRCLIRKDNKENLNDALNNDSMEAVAGGEGNVWPKDGNGWSKEQVKAVKDYYYSKGWWLHVDDLIRNCPPQEYMEKLKEYNNMEQYNALKEAFGL